MLKKISLLTIASCLCLWGSGEELTIVTQNSKPFNYVKKGKVVGITVDIAKDVFTKAGMKFNQDDIVVDSLSTVLNQTMTNPNTLLLTTVRMPSRERLMQWVGPLADIRLVVVAKKATNVTINSPQDFSKYKIATFKNTGPESALIKKGAKAKDLKRVSTPKQAYKLLELGRVDAVAAADMPFLYNLIEKKKNINDYEIVYVLKRVKFYMGLNLETPNEVVQKLQNALNETKKADANGISDYSKIMSAYFSKDAKLSVK